MLLLELSGLDVVGLGVEPPEPVGLGVFPPVLGVFPPVLDLGVIPPELAALGELPPVLDFSLPFRDPRGVGLLVGTGVRLPLRLSLGEVSSKEDIKISGVERNERITWEMEKKKSGKLAF